MKKNLIVSLVALVLCASIMASCTKTPAVSTSNPGNSASKGTSSEVNVKDDDKKEYIKGVLTETTYESEFFEIKFTTPEEFLLTTEDEMLDIAKQSGATVKADGTVDYQNTPIVFEMITAHTTGAPNITVIAEKIPMKNMSVEQYAEAAKKQMTGSTFLEDGKLTAVEIGGKEHMMLKTSTSAQGQTLLQDVYMRKVGSYVLLMSVTYTEDDNGMKDKLLAGFSAYN